MTRYLFRNAVLRGPRFLSVENVHVYKNDET